MGNTEVETGFTAVLNDRSEGPESAALLLRLQHLSHTLLTALTAEQVADALLFARNGPLRADERAFLETVAQMGALALERVRLCDAERRDITERKQTEAFQQTINDLFLHVAQATEPGAILQLVVTAVGKVLEADGCTMIEVDVAKNESEVLVGYSVGPPVIAGTYALSDWIEPEAIPRYQQGKTQVVEDTAADPLTVPRYETQYRPLHIAAFVTVPYLRGGQWVGTLSLYTRRLRKWRPQEVAFVEVVAERGWLSLDNARLFQAERERSEQLSLAILEVHHRVKNNLQAVSALLELQIGPDMTLLPVESVQDSLSQIKTIALVHDLLARDRPIGAVNIAQVLTNLAELLSLGMRRGEHPLRIQMDVEPLWLSTKAATSLALAVNELLTNAAKHHEPIGREGAANHDAIEVRLLRQNGDVLVTVQDHGPGFAPDFDPVMDANLGLQLVLTLVGHDLHGAVSFANHFDPGNGERPAGGRVEITFSEQSLPE